ncbi:MAG TPA: hypothetical protein VGC56_16940 [Allosphingosinicella sp.]|jgi:hypothetical protein
MPQDPAAGAPELCDAFREPRPVLATATAMALIVLIFALFIH